MVKEYDKKPKSDEELAGLLISRGLVVEKDQLIKLFKAVGYYRLTGYLYPFRCPDSEDFVEGTSLERVWRIYTFDRKLRLMAMDALARIEVAVRTLIIKFHSEAFPDDAFCYTKPDALPGLSENRRGDFLKSVAQATRNARQESDIAHLRRIYGIEEYPPIWNMMEHVPFGVVTLYYEGLPPSVKQSVANTFFIQPNAFMGVLMTLKKTRNICAHHSRFWNRRISSRIAKTLGVRDELSPLRECLSCQDGSGYTSVFSVLSICAHCIRYVRTQSRWTKRCKALLETADSFVLRGMGVPENWAELQLWS